MKIKQNGGNDQFMLLENLRDQISLLSEEIEIFDSILLKQQNKNFESKTNYDYIDENEIRLNQDSTVKYLNVQMISKQIMKLLNDNAIPLKYFIMIIFNKGSKYVPNFIILLTQATQWSQLNEVDQKKYIMMREFLRDPEGIQRFLNVFRKFNQKTEQDIVDRTEEIKNIKSVYQENNKPQKAEKPSVVETVKPNVVKAEKLNVVQTVKSNVVETVKLKKKRILDEFLYLNDNFVKDIKKFLETHNISSELFANVICGVNSRKLRYLFEKTEHLLMCEQKGTKPKYRHGINDTDRKHLTNIEFLLKRKNDLERKNFFDDCKSKYYRKFIANDEVSDKSKMMKKRGRKPKLKKPIGKFNENSSTALLKAYYRANSYPNDKVYETISIDCSIPENDVRDFFFQRQNSYPLISISIHQYCQLMDFFNKISDKPSAKQIEDISRQNAIDPSYVRKWFIRQRTIDFEFKSILQRKATLRQIDTSEECDSLSSNNQNECTTTDDLNATQIIELEKAFDESPVLNEDTLTTLSDKLDLSMDQVFKWFKEKRLANESMVEEEENDDNDEGDDEIKSRTMMSDDDTRDTFI